MVGEAKHPSGETGPLDGITVLDLSRVLVGPFCTMQLGDLGANVIKIERPGVGDTTRQWKPPTYGDSDESAYYLSVNRNKQSIALDLSTEAGREIVTRIAAEADVLVENFRVGRMAEWGLDYATLHEECPHLIYCAISGFGEWGPDRDEPAYDITMQARGGLMSITGIEDGPPVRVGVALADIGAGMYATQAILAALFARERGNGVGQKIDVSLLDGQAAWMSYQAVNYFATGTPPGRMGSKHPNIVPYRAFETADGYVVVACTTDSFWERLCNAIDRPHLFAQDRFASNAGRVANRGELEPMLEETFRSLSTADAIDRLSSHDVPVSEVKDMRGVFEDPQILARGMRQSIDHPTIDDLDVPGSPMHFSRTPTTVRRHPPRLGEHTTEVLEEYGVSKRELQRLRSVGAIPSAREYPSEGG